MISIRGTHWSIALADFEKDPIRADFLRRYSLDRLPNDPKLRQRAAEFLRKQGKEDLAREVEELKDQMYRYRDRIDTVNQVAFGWAQSEVEAAVLFRKAWQAVKIIDFLGSQDRQTAGVSGHVR